MVVRGAMQTYLLVSRSDRKALELVAAVALQLPSQQMQQCCPGIQMDCAQSPSTPLSCTAAFLGITCRSSSAHPGCGHGLNSEFQFPMLEADGEPALQYQRQAPQAQPGKGGAEHGPAMSGWAGLLKMGPLPLWQNRQPL